MNTLSIEDFIMWERSELVQNCSRIKKIFCLVFFLTISLSKALLKTTEEMKRVNKNSQVETGSKKALKELKKYCLSINERQI